MKNLLILFSGCQQRTNVKPPLLLTTILSILLMFYSCQNDKVERGPTREVRVKAPSFLKIEHDSINKLGEEALIKLYFTDQSFKICNAYGFCEKDSMKYINVVENKIIACSRRLYISNDTIKIGLTPNDPGKFVFEGIKILYRDQDSNYYVADTSVVLNIK